LTVLALPLATVAAAPAEIPTTEFANRIFAASGPGTMTLTLRNASNLDAAQLQVIRTGIETQLRNLGIKFADAGQTQVRVTLSRNTRGLVWIAEVTQATTLKVVMLSVPNNGLGEVATHGQMSLRKQLLFSADEPILDVLHVNAPKALIALAPTEVIVFQPNGNGWTEQQKVPITREAVMPRDPRGDLVAATDHFFDLYLPGTVCSSGAVLPLTLSCHDADDLWPLGGQNAFFNSSRNYFTGLLRPGFAKPVTPFYSAASVAIADRNLWIFAGIDGQVRWTDGGAEQFLAATSEWGSDIATLHSGCGAGTQVIAAAKGDDSDEDSVRAFEILNQQASAVTTPLTFPGSVTSLWTQIGEVAVTATIHTTKGSYEVYAIDLSCN
jgi:hypothetical protein